MRMPSAVHSDFDVSSVVADWAAEMHDHDWILWSLDAEVACGAAALRPSSAPAERPTDCAKGATRPAARGDAATGRGLEWRPSLRPAGVLVRRSAVRRMAGRDVSTQTEEVAEARPPPSPTRRSPSPRSSAASAEGGRRAASSAAPQAARSRGRRRGQRGGGWRRMPGASAWSFVTWNMQRIAGRSAWRLRWTRWSFMTAVGRRSPFGRRRGVGGANGGCGLPRSARLPRARRAAQVGLVVHRRLSDGVRAVEVSARFEAPLWRRCMHPTHGRPTARPWPRSWRTWPPRSSACWQRRRRVLSWQSGAIGT